MLNKEMSQRSPWQCFCSPGNFQETCKTLIFLPTGFPEYLYLNINHFPELCHLSVVPLVSKLLHAETMPFGTKIITHFYQVLKKWATVAVKNLILAIPDILSLRDQSRSRPSSTDLVKELDTMGWAFSQNYQVQEIVKNSVF